MTEQVPGQIPATGPWRMVPTSVGIRLDASSGHTLATAEGRGAVAVTTMPSIAWLTADELRALAAYLTRAADRVERKAGL